VVERLAGPETAAAAGVLELRPELRRWLEDGELYLHLMTRADPFGTQGTRVVLP